MSEDKLPPVPEEEEQAVPKKKAERKRRRVLEEEGQPDEDSDAIERRRRTLRLNAEIQERRRKFIRSREGWEPAEVALARESTLRSGRSRAKTSRHSEETESKINSTPGQQSETTPAQATEKSKITESSETNEEKVEIKVSIKTDSDEPIILPTQSPVAAEKIEQQTESNLEQVNPAIIFIQTPEPAEPETTEEESHQKETSESPAGGEKLLEEPATGGISDLISAAIAVATPECSPSREEKESEPPEITKNTAASEDIGGEGSPEY